MDDVTKKIGDLLRENPWMEGGAVRHCMERIARENLSVKLKRKKVIAIADRMTAALAPHVACKAGCSQCCHMNTMIYEHEAVRLAEVSGRAMKRLPFRPRDVVVWEGDKFNGQPCPFLVNNQCSVYEDRPLVCRTHHSLHENASLCDMGIPASQQVRPPMYDPDLVETPYAAISEAHRAREPWGNIGEFFPDHASE